MTDEPVPPRPARARRWVGGAVAGCLVLSAAYVADRARFQGRVDRRVSAASVDLSGMTEAEARAAIDARSRAIESETVSAVIGDVTETVTRSAMGARLDTDAIVGEALQARRDSGWRAIASWLHGWFANRELRATTTIDPDVLGRLFDRWEREVVPGPFNGSVALRSGELVLDLPHDGVAIDRDAAERDALRACADADGAWRVPLVPATPQHEARALATALEEARKLTAGPMALQVELPADPPSDEVVPGPGSPAPFGVRRSSRREESPPPDRVTVRFSREQLLAAVRVTVPSTRSPIEVGFDGETLDAMMADFRRVVERPAVEAHFEIAAGDRPVAVPGRPGRTVRTDAVRQALVAAAATPDRRGTLELDPHPEPTTGVAELESLGITRLVSQFTTSHPCCMPRVDNIHRIADRMDGVIVKPGATFSVNEHVGERTIERGFKAAPTILYGEMGDTVGGGISQFATTLFNAVFYGGYDIVERTPHSFYIPRYPMGHEATLSYPKPDLVFRNDTDAGLLIRCSYTKTSITVRLYGDNGGRRVQRKVSRVRDVVKPPVEYVPDAGLDPEERRVKERGQVGWTVAVSRILEFPDGTSRTEERNVVYQPRVRRIRVHPCRVPIGAKGYTGETCPETADASGNDGEESREAPADVPRPEDVRPDRVIEDEG